jgi:class 3 adenylate cyclase
MDASRNTSTADLLLEVMELSSLGPSTRSQLAKQLRRSHPFARTERRLTGVLEILEAEGLIETSLEAGGTTFRTSPSGLATLEAKGRFSATAAVLFTDIVGSTELIGTFGEADAHGLRQRHFALLREAIAGSGGREVKNLGDGLMVIFGRPGPAAQCANAMQQQVAADDDQLGLRIGIHAGELLRDGDDYFGSTVITARRLCDDAESGQTLVSTATCTLLSSDLEATTESVGSLELKGLSAPVPTSMLHWSTPIADLVA